MSDVTLTKAEHEMLTGAKALMDKLLTGKTKRDAERLIKQAAPEIEIRTDDEIIEPAIKQIDDLSKQIAELKGQLSDEKIDKDLEAEFSALRNDGFTNEGIEDIKKVMVDRKIKSPLDAAAVWNRLNPPTPQPPTGFQPTGWFDGVDRDEELKRMFNDTDAWADDLAGKVWAEEAKKNQIRT